MCGIAGQVVQRVSNADTGAVRRMLDALARRGPDGEGAWSDGRAAFGHRRLAIFDLTDAGSQPMVAPDRQVVVVFNGAIYNWRGLREELERGGFTFHSATDTEVLVHGYRAWGIDGLVARLRGMFAFAVWDELRETLFLVRDRLGVKPLVYAERDGALAFASTVRALRRAGVVGTVDDVAMAEFLEYGYVTEQRAIYRDATKLPPATILEWHDGRTTSRRYWTPPAAGAAGSVAFEDAVAETERLLLAAVERRLDADVPVGALLSGGIDSALVCWAIGRLGGDVTAFTVGVPGHAEDESDDAHAAARAIGIRHRLLPMGEPGDEVVDLVTAYAEPFAVGSALGMLRVSRAVRESATVLLTGDGGDDVFLGYPRHQMLQRLERAARAIPQPVASAWYRARGLVPSRGVARRAKHTLDYATGGLGAFVSATPGLPALRARGMLGERLRDVTVAGRRIPWSVRSARHSLRDYLEYDLGHQFVSEYLVKVDGATMHHGLEARSPFLDQELWEFAASLPYDVRLHRGQLKAPLRELARRRVGERTAGGAKRGFVIPVERWLASRWRGRFGELFADSMLERGGWIARGAGRAALDAVPDGGTAPQQLWYLLVAESWLRHEAGA
jgi:asparagine synthase (glutamine-hydrolysing)